MLDIENIESLCALGISNVGGLQKLRVTDQSNIGISGIEPGAIFYDISFTRSTGRYSEKHNRSRAGEYNTVQAQAFIPRKRFNVEMMRTKLTDKRVAVQITDRNGELSLLTNCKFTCNYDSGSSFGSRHGYDISFNGVDLKRGYIPLITTVSINGNEGSTGGSDFSVDIEPGDNTPVASDTCCVSIITTPINYVPTPSGNSQKNKFVTTLSGDKYFIDNNGVSFFLGGPRIRHISTTESHIHFVDTFSLSDISDPNIELLVLRNGVILHYNANPPANLEQYSIQGDNILIDPDFPLESNETLYIFKLKN